MEGRDIDLKQVQHPEAPPGLHLDYGLDFQSRRVEDIAPTLTSPLLSSLVDNIHQLEEPVIPKRPTSFKADGGLWGLNWAPPKADTLDTSCKEGVASGALADNRETLEDEPSSRGGSTLGQPLFEDMAEIIISEDNESDFPVEVTEAAPSPRRVRAQCRRQSSEGQDTHMPPPKKWATKEEEGSMPQREANLPRGMKMEDILPRRYETLTTNNSWVQEVRCSLLGSEAGTTPSKEDINTSEQFMPRAAAWESEPPDIITDHWLPILWREGFLAECHPNQFTMEPDWVPLYTKACLQKHIPAALSAFPNAGPLSLTAVVPPDF